MKVVRNMKTTMTMFGFFVVAMGVGCGNVEPKDADHAENTPAALSDGSDKPEGKRTAKPSAPVVIDGKVETSKALLAVGFVSEATDVSIDAWGVDGLTVSSMRLVRGGQPVSLTRFAKGERVDVEVVFTASTTVRTNLAIRVRGNFGGSVRERVQSFTVNGDLPAATKAPGEVKVGPDGKPVRVMKAQ